MKTGRGRDVFAKRSFGQNFLCDQRAVSRIIHAANLRADDNVIEIGPGRGALTEKLIAACATVTAIEADPGLLPFLRQKFAGASNFRLIAGDALKTNFTEIYAAGSAVKVVANLPYNISTAILQKLASERDIFKLLVLMFQREVADRITALPCDSQRGYLSVLVQRAFTIEKLFDLPPEAFRPRPKVTSTVIRLTPKNSPSDDNGDFLALLSLAFRQKRKTLANNLKSAFDNAAEIIKSAGIDPSRRAESLADFEWEKLNEIIRETRHHGFRG